MTGGDGIRVAWATDIHLDHAGPEAAFAFIERVKKSGAAALLVGGDIATALDLDEHLVDLADMSGIPVYFVLGNHDYYGGSVAQVRQRVVALDYSGLRWLPAGGPEELVPGVTLVGHGGWGDAVLGDFPGSDVVLSDYLVIEELRKAFNAVEFTGIFGAGTPLEAELRRLGHDAADTLAPQLEEAAKTSPQVIVLTHVPPFREASWHEGMISGETWLPAFTCGAIGELLLRVAGENPECHFTVLCGHTHGKGTARLADNLVAYTQGAEYGHPDFHLVKVRPDGVEWPVVV